MLRLFNTVKTPRYQFIPTENNIEVLNFWPGAAPNQLWMYQFIRHRLGHLLSQNKTLLLASVFGPRHHIKESPAAIKIFFSGENLKRFKAYADYCLSEVDLSLGFEYLAYQNYIRFPLWITYLFPVDANRQSIQNSLDNISKNIRARAEAQRQFCALICSHDKNGIRTKLMKKLDSIAPVASAGKYRNNTTELKEQYNDNKHDFLQHYKFNICTENSNLRGYVTEKLFQAIAAGTIPIYWGSDNNPEPHILNSDAILFYNRKNVNELVQQVERLHRNARQYLDFVNQDRFAPHAAEYIAEMLNGLEQKIREAIVSKQP